MIGRRYRRKKVKEYVRSCRISKEEEKDKKESYDVDETL